VNRTRKASRQPPTVEGVDQQQEDAQDRDDREQPQPARGGLRLLVIADQLALYRGGRAPEALRAYRAVRSRLVDEFGLDPHAQLQQLERAILRGDPLLDLPGAGIWQPHQRLIESTSPR
jgi:Bacterial transcriptional activator domain